MGSEISARTATDLKRARKGKNRLTRKFQPEPETLKTPEMASPLGCGFSVAQSFALMPMALCLLLAHGLKGKGLNDVDTFRIQHVFECKCTCSWGRNPGCSTSMGPSLCLCSLAPSKCNGLEEQTLKNSLPLLSYVDLPGEPANAPYKVFVLLTAIGFTIKDVWSSRGQLLPNSKSRVRQGVVLGLLQKSPVATLQTKASKQLVPTEKSHDLNIKPSCTRPFHPKVVKVETFENSMVSPGNLLHSPKHDPVYMLWRITQGEGEEEIKPLEKQAGVRTLTVRPWCRKKILHV